MYAKMITTLLGLGLVASLAAGQNAPAPGAKTDSAQIYLDKGRELFQSDKPDEALTAFERAITLKPDLEEAWRGKGVALWRLDRQEEAMTATEKALELKPDDFKAWKNQARIFMRMGKTEEAVKALQKAAEIKPDDEEALTGQVYLLRDMGKIDDMIMAMDRLIAQKPDYPKRWMLKAMETTEAGRPDVGLEAMTKLTEMLPDTGGIPFGNRGDKLTQGVAWIGKGQCLDALNRNDEALAALDKAVAMEPTNTDALNIRGTILSKLKKYDEAMVMYQKALEIQPQFGGARYNMACAYALKGDKANALKNLEQAVSMESGFKQAAPKDEDFKSLWNDPEFKKLTQ